MSATVETAGAIEAIRNAGGVHITGPSAMAGGWRRIVSLTWTLGYLDWRLAFFGSALGYLWRLIKPGMYFGVYSVLFTQLIPLGGDVKFHAPLMLFGIMLYLFFNEATNAAVASVLTRENLVRKIHFPRVVIPMAVIVTAMLNLAFNLLAVAVFMILSGVPLRSTAWQIIPAFALLLAFTTGIAMLVAAVYVRFRDVQPIWEVVSMALFYATPILYPIEAVKFDWARELIMHNPLAVTIQQIRHAVFDPSVPGAAATMGGWDNLAIVVVFVFAVFGLGLWTFNRAAPHVAENL